MTLQIALHPNHKPKKAGYYLCQRVTGSRPDVAEVRNEKDGLWMFHKLGCFPIKQCEKDALWSDEISFQYCSIISGMFGHGETKATCLWLKNIPPLKPTDIVSGRHTRVHLEPPSPLRRKNRSRTYQGIANAMAEQWGELA
jgi:hypothetical protein